MESLRTITAGINDEAKRKETSNSNSTDTALSSTRTLLAKSRAPNTRTTQNFRLVWLDSNIDEINNDDSINIITKLRHVVNAVNKFTDIDECIEFMTGIENEKIFMVASGTFGQKILPNIHDMVQIDYFYILCRHKERHEGWAKEWPKVKGVYTDITSICKELKQAARYCDQNTVSISFVKPTDGIANQKLDELDQSFMYTQILKEILLTIDFEQVHINEFLTHCREQFAGNTTELNNVDRIEKEYYHHQPIWWYTYNCFLYSMLNRVLRLMEVDRIIKMGFFVRDLHNHIVLLHSKQYAGQNHSNSFIVYRGQGLSQTDFDQVLKTKGGLMSFNNFLSTSLDRAVSVAFAESNADNRDLIGVLFEITIDPSITSSSFAKVVNVSQYQEEEEILFSMHSVFRIVQVERIDMNNRLWQVTLTLTGDSDPQLLALTERMREETKGSNGWLRLGKLMVKLAEYDKAENLHDTLLAQTADEMQRGDILFKLGGINFYQGRYADAMANLKSALQVRQNTLTSQHPDVAECHNDIGVVYETIGEYSKALSYYEKALEIRQEILPPKHPTLATSYNNIGVLYGKMGEHSKALSYYEKALQIRQETLPSNHPSLATSYASHGFVYSNMGEYSKALSYCKKALEIRIKTLPPNHTSLANSYNNIGSVYDKMGEYSKALSYYEKALGIRLETLAPNHPHLAASYTSHGFVYSNMGQYSKALSYYEKALQIRQETLPSNHPSLATSYNNIGSVYDKMGEYSKALSYCDKALEIRQETPTPDHPDLAISYACYGSVYSNMGEYSKALPYCEKALEIRQKTLPQNHPDVGTSYNNIGWIYRNMNNYLRAFPYFERALEIYQCSLPSDHPHVKNVQESIEFVKNELGNNVSF